MCMGIVYHIYVRAEIIVILDILPLLQTHGFKTHPDINKFFTYYDTVKFMKYNIFIEMVCGWSIFILLLMDLLMLAILKSKFLIKEQR